MTIHYRDDRVTVHHGDCLDVLRAMPDDSVDAIVTDPPYGLEFMGKDWDRFRTADTVYRWHGQGLAVNSGDTTKSGADEMSDRLQALPSLTYKANLKCRTCGRWQRGRANGKCDCPTPDFEPRKNERNLGFQRWCEQWTTECLRVLKPGGHLLAFGGTRTWHRLAVAVEDAGFEMRDSIAWLYGSGFPKSLDVSKAIDKAAPRAGMFSAFAAHYAERRKALGLTHSAICAAVGAHGAHNKGGASVNWEKGYGVPTREQWTALSTLLEMPHEMWEPLIARAEAQRDKTGERDVPVGHAFAGETYGGNSSSKSVDITAPATPAAQQWAGWGSNLKPAHEPIVVARKPLAGTIAQNVLTYGTGALNIDGCRVGYASAEDERRVAEWPRPNTAGVAHLGDVMNRPATPTVNPSPAGRWPANVLLSGDAAAELDADQPITTSLGGSRGTGAAGYAGGPLRPQPELGPPGYGDTGGPSRYFPVFKYQAKAPARERPSYIDANGVKQAHSTVKPLSLMRWLCRLVGGQPGSLILDPFAGSGTTVEAAILEGFRVIGIEREADYLPLIEARIARNQTTDEGLPAAVDALALFDVEEPA